MPLLLHAEALNTAKSGLVVVAECPLVLARFPKFWLLHHVSILFFYLNCSSLKEQHRHFFMQIVEV